MNYLCMLCFVLLGCQVSCAQMQVKQRIAWETIEQGATQKAKRTTNYNLAGGIETVYYKVEGKAEYLQEAYTYNAQGQLTRVDYYHSFGKEEMVLYQYHKGFSVKKEYHYYNGAAGLTNTHYYYKNKEGQIIEEKSYDSASELERWLLKTYDYRGRLIGERYKKTTLNLSKRIFVYKKQTNVLLAVQAYVWDAKLKKNVISSKNCSMNEGYVYDYENRLIERTVGCSPVLKKQRYQYQDEHLLVETEEDSWKKIKHIYKWGDLVRTKITYKKTGGQKEINYQYKYYQNYQAFAEFNFEEGGYSLVGRRWSKKKAENPNFIDSLGEWYVNDISVLNQLKAKWTFSRMEESPSVLCPYSYIVDLCKNGKPVKQFEVNIHCNEIVLEDGFGSLGFKQQQLFFFKKKLKKAVERYDAFESITKARRAYYELLKKPNLVGSQTVDWLNFEGTFRVEIVVEKEASVVEDFANKLTVRYPKEAFVLERKVDFWNEDKTVHTLSIEITCNKSLFDQYDLPVVEKEVWKPYGLYIYSYWSK